MVSWRAALLHDVALAVFGSVVVATPLPLNLAAFVAWALVVRGWARRRNSQRGRQAGLIAGVLFQQFLKTGRLAFLG